MSTNDELRHLRHDLDEVLRRTTEMAERLTRLESRIESQPAVNDGVVQGEPPPFPAFTSPRPDSVCTQETPAGFSENPAEALHLASRQGNVEWAKQCIEKGAGVNDLMEDKSALDVAIEAGRLDVIRLLVAQGAAIEHAPALGKSHIRRAQLLGFGDIADFLEGEVRKQPQGSPSASPMPPSKTKPVYRPSIKIDSPAPFLESPLGKYLRVRMDEIRLRTREVGWEAQLGTYWLPRIAVVCISIAVMFFLTLAIERWGAAWMPHLRVGIGYTVAAGLLLLAWRSEKKYSGLARVLYGGGFAVMYFVTFATHYVEFAHIFDSPAVTLLLLAAIVLGWAIVAQIRQSKVIAALVTVLGHLTVMLSTLSMEQSAPFSMPGLLFLSVGSTFFLVRNRWYYVAFLGMLGSYLNDFLALAHGHAENPHTAFIASMGVIAAFYLMFALAELFSPEELRRKAVSGWIRNAFVSINTAWFLVLGTIIVNNFDFTRHHQDIFRFFAAGVLLLMGGGYLRFRAGDPLYNVYFVKSAAMATLALATRYGSGALAVGLAVEMAVLLLSARRTHLIVIRILALIVSVIAFVQSMQVAALLFWGTAPWSFSIVMEELISPISYGAPGYFRNVFDAVLSILAFFFASHLYQRTDWAAQSPRTLPFSLESAPELYSFCWKMDLIAERPEGLKETDKPLQGMLIPSLYALAGAALCLAYVLPLVGEGHRCAVLSGIAILLTSAAALGRAKPLGGSAALLFAFSGLLLGVPDILLASSINLPVVLPGLAAAALVVLASEDRWFGRYQGLACHVHPASSCLLYGICAWLTVLLLIKEFPGGSATFALAVAAVLAAGLFKVLNPLAWILITAGCIAAGTVVYLQVIFGKVLTEQTHIDAAACALAVVSLLADRYFSQSRKAEIVRPYICTGLVLNAACVLLCYFEVRVLPEWRMAVTSLACYGFLAYAALFRSPGAAAVSLAGTSYASLRHAIAIFNASGLHSGLIAAFVFLAAFWMMVERIYRPVAARCEMGAQGTLRGVTHVAGMPGAALVPIGLSTAVLLLLFDRIPHLAPYNLVFITIGWFLLAAGLFVFSLVMRQKLYRYAGLAVIVLSLMRLFLIDMKEQDPLLRVAAFAVVGAGLLCISIGYYRAMGRFRTANPGVESPPDAVNRAE